LISKNAQNDRDQANNKKAHANLYNFEGSFFLRNSVAKQQMPYKKNSEKPAGMTKKLSNSNSDQKTTPSDGPLIDQPRTHKAAESFMPRFEYFDARFRTLKASRRGSRKRPREDREQSAYADVYGNGRRLGGSVPPGAENAAHLGERS
jgi:hypothetical protein